MSTLKRVGVLRQNAIYEISYIFFSDLSALLAYQRDAVTSKKVLGCASIDRVLIYGTAGAAWLNVDYSRPNFDPLVINNTLTGWTAGAGIEYAFAQNWTGRVEYRFARFGSEGFPFTTGTQRTLRETETNTVRAGISYKFGGGF